MLPSGVSAPLRYDWFGLSSSVWSTGSSVSITQCCPVVLVPHSGMIGMDHLLLLVYRFISEYHTVLPSGVSAPLRYDWFGPSSSVWSTGSSVSITQCCPVVLVPPLRYVGLDHLLLLVYRFISEYHTVLPSGVSAPLRYDWFGPSSSVWSTGSSVSVTQCCPVVLVPHSGMFISEYHTVLPSGVSAPLRYVHQWVSHSVAQWC